MEPVGKVMDMDVSCAGEAAKSCFGVFCGLGVMKMGRRRFEPLLRVGRGGFSKKRREHR